MKKTVIQTCIIALCLFVACAKNNSKASSNKEVNDCLGVSVPFPASAIVTACTDAVVGKSVGFRYAVTWEEAVRFFTKAYSTNGWELTHEFIEDNEPGRPRKAKWDAVKNDLKVSCSLDDFRVDESSGSITGIILYYSE